MQRVCSDNSGHTYIITGARKTIEIALKNIIFRNNAFNKLIKNVTLLRYTKTRSNRVATPSHQLIN